MPGVEIEFIETGLGRQKIRWTGQSGPSQAIYRSSNIYFYDVASRMDIGRLASFTEQFGYGKKLILDFPTVVTGLVPNEEWKLKVRGEKWYQGDTVNLGIGQGDLLVTPVQVAYLAATIANQGRAS